MRPKPSNAPSIVVRGIKSKTAVINSAMPVQILPHGSMPNFVNNSTDSGWAVNLKYNVCSNITAAIMRSSQIKIVLTIIGNIINIIAIQLSGT